MVLGQPEPGEAGLLSLLGHQARIGKRIGHRAPLDDGAEIENGKGGHRVAFWDWYGKGWIAPM